MKVWITKYALTKGIFGLDVFDDCIPIAIGKHSLECYNSDDKEWCRTREEAVLIAEDMKETEIEHLKKQIEKLEKMKFE